VAQQDLLALANRAGLTATSPTPDANGLDVVLEQLPDVLQRGALDARPAHPICNIQLKATLGARPQARLSLSALDPLAKSGTPSAVCILQYDTELNCRAAFMVHLLNDRLGTALKALRRHGVLGQGTSNDAFWTVTARDSERFEFTPLGLMSSFTSIVGESMRKYSAVKTEQLDTLGYPKNGRFSLKGEFSGPLTDIIDGFLGLGPMPIGTVEGWETRFGIPVRLFEGKPENFRIEFGPAARGILRATAMNGESAEVTAALSTPPLPGLPAEAVKQLIRTPLGDFVTTSNGWNYAFVERPATLQQWRSECALHSVIASGKVDFEFLIEGDRVMGWRATPQSMADHDRSQLEAGAALVTKAAELLDAAGIGDCAVDTRMLIDQQRNIRDLHGLYFGTVPWEVVFDVTSSGEDPPPHHILLIVSAKIAEVWLVMACEMVLRTDGSEWRMTPSRMLGIEPLGETLESDFDRFAKRIGRAAGLTLALKLKPRRFSGSEPLAGTFDAESSHVSISIEELTDTMRRP